METLIKDIFEKRKIMITTKLGVLLLKGITILTDEEILKIFDKSKFGIFIEGEESKRLDLK